MGEGPPRIRCPWAPNVLATPLDVSSLTQKEDFGELSELSVGPMGGTRLWLGRGCAARTSGPLLMFRVKNVPMFRDFAPKMDPCLGILLQKQAF